MKNNLSDKITRMEKEIKAMRTELIAANNNTEQKKPVHGLCRIRKGGQSKKNEILFGVEAILEDGSPHRFNPYDHQNDGAIQKVWALHQIDPTLFVTLSDDKEGTTLKTKCPIGTATLIVGKNGSISRVKDIDLSCCILLE